MIITVYAFPRFLPSCVDKFNQQFNDFRLSAPELHLMGHRLHHSSWKEKEKRETWQQYFSASATSQNIMFYQKSQAITSNFLTVVVHLGSIMYKASNTSVHDYIYLLVNMRLKKGLAAANTTLWAGKCFPWTTKVTSQRVPWGKHTHTHNYKELRRGGT